MSKLSLDYTDFWSIVEKISRRIRLWPSIKESSRITELSINKTKANT
jgi:hypothetical protein